MFWQLAVGGIVSETVTVAEHADVFELTSVTVITTVFAPTLLQSKLLISKTCEAKLQLPLELLSMANESIVALPLPSR